MADTSSYAALIINNTKYESLSSALPLTFVGSPRAAKTLLADPAKRYAAVFLDPRITNPGGVKMISLAHQHRPVTPIYLLYETEVPFSKADLAKLSVHGAIPVPLSSPLIRERVNPGIFDFLFEAPKTDPYYGLKISEDDRYLPVIASDFLTGSTIFHDVYVRLPSARYVKILSAGDILTPERVLSYMEKGLTHFFLTQESHQRGLSYCDAMAHFILTHSSASNEIKITELFNRGQDIVDAIRARKLTPEHVEFALVFIATLRDFLREMKLDYHEKIGAFINSVPAYDHAVSVTMVAGLLALPLGIQGEAAFRAIGLASLFSDISLNDMPEKLRLASSTGRSLEEQLTEEELAKYKSHPAVSAEMLSEISDIDSVVIQAIAQHHERRNNSGFPNKGGFRTVNRVAELIGIADEFVTLLQRAKSQPGIDPFREMKAHFDGFSYPVIEAFRAVFLPGERASGGPLTPTIL